MFLVVLSDLFVGDLNLKWLMIFLMISFILGLEMNIIITTNCTNGKITGTNAIPTAKLESNVSKYLNNGSTETSTIKCRIAPSEMLRMLSE